VAETRLDFRSPRRIGDVELDTAYAQPRADDDGLIRVSLTTAEGDRVVTVWMDDTHHFIMVYGGDTLADPARRRRSLAVEPMTCAPDAFNSGLGLVVLQPGEEYSTTWGITATASAG
jgi:aldose 1-epimerase